MTPQFLGIIPARYASTRFPGKPLALLGEKPVVQWVYETASKVFPHLVVATDDRRISETVEGFGGKAVMTSSSHPSGTDRCAEALHLVTRASDGPFTHVVNIQGDEPLIRKEHLSLLKQCMLESEHDIATLIRPLEDQDELDSPHVVKAVVDKSYRALYFSRASIPYQRDRGTASDRIPLYAHLGLYAFRTEILEQVVLLPRSPLEIAESLEQLRWLENGYSIQTAITRYHARGVDTPEDLELLRSKL
ncbi:MAG: 3-deoxy-manno-octulosonate cytidylyltransferase [Bacteroidales bacterium]